MNSFLTNILVVAMLVCLGLPSLGQSNIVRYGRTNYKGESILTVELKPVTVFARKADMRRYERLIRIVKKVYPIARYANERMLQLEAELARIPTKREREQHVKAVEKELIKTYTPILKRMSISQGRILIKLIDRQTGSTSYALLKEFRGSISAAFWQTIARIFGSNLKDHYDAEGEDRIIEMIIKMYEAGEL